MYTTFQHFTQDVTKKPLYRQQTLTSVQEVFLPGRHRVQRRAGSRTQCRYQIDRKVVQHIRQNEV